MQIKTNITTERVIDLELPIFWKKVHSYGITEYLALFSENHCAKIYDAGRNSRQSIIHSKPNSNYEIIAANDTWEKITEAEFLTVHRNMLNSLSLEPVLKEADIEMWHHGWGKKEGI